MNICSGEYFGRLDPFSNYSTIEEELEDKINKKEINKQDLIDFLGEGYINIKQFIEAVRYADILEEKED